MPTRTKIAINGMFYNFFLKKNMKKMQPHVNPRVKILKFEKVKVIISRGLVKGVSFDAKKKAFIFSIAKGKNCM